MKELSEQSPKQRIRVAVVFWGIVLVGLLAFVVIRLGYDQSGTGFGPTAETFPACHKGIHCEYHPGKTLWDWMQLALLPLVVAGVGLVFNYVQNRTQERIQDDQNKEAALGKYIDEVLRVLRPDSGTKYVTKVPAIGVPAVLRARTGIVLRILDGARKGVLLRFLYELQLIDRETHVVDLRGLDLTKARLSGALLINAYLCRLSRIVQEGSHEKYRAPAGHYCTLGAPPFVAGDSS